VGEARARVGDLGVAAEDHDPRRLVEAPGLGKERAGLRELSA
jgi:hypothetical protein